MSSTSTAVTFKNVSRIFGKVRAVDNVSLQIASGEFFAMLGPSGCGKTTSLRLIAGFEQPDTGDVELFGDSATGIPPYKRNVNTVFQDYALFPHMTIRDNVAYGLMVKGIGRNDRYRKAEEALRLVALPDYGDRRPGQLSGGQRQRVALARALVNEPKVLLLDEPLGALDLKLREQMQVELKTLQRKLGITFVFVTHDQGEALSMADRVAVFNQGKIVQIATPAELYERPATRFVADFVGSSNVLSPEFTGLKHWASLRPEKIAVLRDNQRAASGTLSYEARISGVHYQGAVTRLNTVTPDGTQVNVSAPGGHQWGVGERVRLTWLVDSLHLMPENH
jgi:putative spermidine/putrescine transport system ATP-binding protein